MVDVSVIIVGVFHKKKNKGQTYGKMGKIWIFNYKYGVPKTEVLRQHSWNRLE